MRLLAATFSLLLLAACAPAGHVSAAEFERQFANIGLAQDIRVVTFLGERDGKAFIRVHQMSTLRKDSWSDHVIYVELDELDPAFRDSLPKRDAGDPHGAPRGRT